MPPLTNERSNRLQKKLEQVHVMVVDGSAKSGELIKDILNQLGFTNVFVANNGFQGVQLTNEVQIDLIISDWQLLVCKNSVVVGDQLEKRADVLPISGTMFVKRLRFSQASPNPFVPVIMLLKSATTEDILQARDSGVDEIVVKPFSADEFCQKIINIIDTPRMFITSKTFRGPCRRRQTIPLPPGAIDRRKKNVRVIRHNEHKRHGSRARK